MKRDYNGKKWYKTTFMLTPQELWSIKYICALTNYTESSILTEAMRRGIEYLEDPRNKTPHKPKVRSNNNKRRGLVMPVDYKLRIFKALYDRGLLYWKMSDVWRIGLRQIIKGFSVRHPELNKIINKIEEEERNETT